MDAIFDAIDTLIAGDADLLAALVGGYHRYEAPQDDTDFPYATIHLIGVRPQDTFTEVGEVAGIQFNIFDDTRSMATVDDCFEKLKLVFDRAELSVTGYNHVYMLRQNAIPGRFEGVWQWSVMYEVMIDKSK